MPPTRPRRPLVKRACLWTAAVVLLPVAYIASVATVYFAMNAEILPADVVVESPVWHVYVQPALWYSFSDWPGSEACHSLLYWSGEIGARMAGE